MLLPSSVTGRTLGLRGSDLARGRRLLAVPGQAHWLLDNHYNRLAPEVTYVSVARFGWQLMLCQL